MSHPFLIIWNLIGVRIKSCINQSVARLKANNVRWRQYGFSKLDWLKWSLVWSFNPYLRQVLTRCTPPNLIDWLINYRVYLAHPMRTAKPCGWRQARPRTPHWTRQTPFVPVGPEASQTNAQTEYGPVDLRHARTVSALNNCPHAPTSWSYAEACDQ